MGVVTSAHRYFPVVSHCAVVKPRGGLCPGTRDQPRRPVSSESHVTPFPVLGPDIFAGEPPTVSRPDDCCYCGFVIESPSASLSWFLFGSRVNRGEGRALFLALGSPERVDRTCPPVSASPEAVRAGRAGCSVCVVSRCRLAVPQDMAVRHYSHWTGVGSEVQRGYVTSLRSHSSF